MLDIHALLRQIAESSRESRTYSIGMSAAERESGDRPPLKKSTAIRGHEIAKRILKKKD